MSYDPGCAASVADYVILYRLKGDNVLMLHVLLGRQAIDSALGG